MSDNLACRPSWRSTDSQRIPRRRSNWFRRWLRNSARRPWLFRKGSSAAARDASSLQVIRDLHCLEAAITYIDNPFGFRSDRQIFFQLRIKALPSYQRFGAGQFGQAIDTSVGEVY